MNLLELLFAFIKEKGLFEEWDKFFYERMGELKKNNINVN